MSKVYEAWDLVHTHSQMHSPILPFSVKVIPILEQKCVVLWLLWPHSHVCMRVHDMDATSNIILAQLMNKVHEGWDFAYSQIYSPILPFSTKPIPMLEQKCVVLWLLWANLHVCMVVHDMDTTSNLL